MGRHQLFKKIPPKEIVLKYLNCFFFKDFNDRRCICKKYFSRMNVIPNIKKIIQELKIFYLPCKSKVYINNITEKKCITILRQFIKVHGYTLISKERYIEGKKMSVYRLIKSDDKVSTPKKQDCKKDIVISFE